MDMSMLRFSPFVSPFERIFDRSIASAFREMENMQKEMMIPYWCQNRNTLNFGSDEVSRTEDGGLRVAVDVSSFSPDELNVTVEGDNILIKGCHKEENSEKGSYVHRQFMRSYRIPDDVDVQQLKSSLTEQGELKIEAPNKNKAIQSQSRAIPIEFKKKDD